MCALLCRRAASFNKAIKVMHYTRRFWYGVRCAWLVQWGTPYGRRYNRHLAIIFMVWFSASGCFFNIFSVALQLISFVGYCGSRLGGNKAFLPSFYRAQ
ncbi:Hypothetical protein PBPRA1699 [Photobacterium profundum SS9]|uniref:Uncharacterized protein n=1 Tax=Photobacterium profundum (strain SS9) TaxID=298386 RepID=Q6LRH0_PHOPR|nr:Hypothetical protein PBPRA1699 [Photobacterium profundum SS9]